MMEKKIILEGITLEDFLQHVEGRKNPDELLTHKEAMDELKIKRTQYNKLKSEGLIPVRGLGTLERVKRSELHEQFEVINFAQNT